jgi:cellulose synthase operon protein C
MSVTMTRTILPLILIATLGLTACESSEQRAARHFESGIALLAAGEVSQALLEFRNVLRLQDDHGEARTLLARSLRMQGDTGSARREYLRLIERHPDVLEGRLALAELAFEAGDWEEAERHGRAAQRIAPENPLAELLGAALNYREAVISDDPVIAQDSANLARTYLEQEASVNLTAWRIVIDHTSRSGDGEATLNILNEAIEARPDIYDFHRLKLRALVDLGRDEEITEALQAMITQFPDFEEPRGMMVAWYMERGDLDAAEAFLRDLAAAPDAGVAEHLMVVEFLQRTRGETAALYELDRLITAGSKPTVDLDTFRALRATILFEQGENDTALGAMETLLEAAEESERTDDLRILYARMLLAVGNSVGARAQVERVLERDAGHVEALKMRAAWLIESDRPTEAISALRTAQASAPRDPQLMTLMGQAHEREGSRELAGERYALAAEFSGYAPQEALRYASFLYDSNRIESAEAVLTSALNVSPQNLDLMRAMTNIQMSRNDWDRVTRLIWQMRALDTAAAHTSANQVEAELLLRQGRTEDTVAFLENLVRQGAGTGAVAQLARTQVLQGQRDGARDLIEAQLADNPSDLTLRFLRAGLHLLEDEAAEAETIYRALVIEHPGAEAPLRVLYSLLQTQGRVEEAEEIIDAAIAAAPGAPMPLLLRAAHLERVGDMESAIAIYEDLYAADSSNLILANNLASLISAHRDDAASLDRAAVIASRLRGTTVPAFQDTFGWIQYRRGNYEEALEYLEPAAAGLPEDPLVQYHLGMTYLALGRTAEARETLDRAIEIAGDDTPLPQFQRAREELQALIGQ